MNARFIIIRGIPAQVPAQVRLPEYDHVVETFPSDGADQSLDARVLPRRSGCSRLVPNAHGTQPLPEDGAIRTVPVPNKITRCTVPGKRLDDLARNPLRSDLSSPRTIPTVDARDAESQGNRAAGTLSSGARRGRLPQCHRHDWSERSASLAMAANPGTYSVRPLTARL